MSTVTLIEPQRRDPERVNIYLDGSFAFGVSLLLVMARNLTVGTRLEPGDIEALRQDDDVERAHAASLNYLSFRPRSTQEVRHYLSRRKLDPAVVEAVVGRLQGAGLLDDHQFARFWVENRQSFQPRGRRALRVEMRGKGLEQEAVEEALESIGDEGPLALEAGRRRAHSLTHLDESEFFRRMTAFLQRRGFGYEVAARATRTLYQEVTGSQGEF